MTLNQSRERLAKAAKRAAYEQGKYGEPLSGSAAMFSEICERGMGYENRGITGQVGIYPNAFKAAHQRGVNGKPFYLFPDYELLDEAQPS